jgi:hypothetical protein
MEKNNLVWLLALVVFNAGCGNGGDGGEDGNGNDDPCAEIVCEEPTPHCCQGVCRQCCEQSHCDDASECTRDSCDEGSCLNEPVADGTSCTGGICCGGECRVGGNCCSNSDCMEGCKGTPKGCEEFATEAGCLAQRGCTWETAFCGGSGWCEFGTEDSCEACGCGWNWDWHRCRGEPYPCETYEDEVACTDCDCEWTPDHCAGTHEPCDSLPNEDICNGQLDCYWSACVDYRCT